jgi:hypothetical protein
MPHAAAVPHPMGGGVPHPMGGGMPHAVGMPRPMGGAPHVMGGVPHVTPPVIGGGGRFRGGGVHFGGARVSGAPLGNASRIGRAPSIGGRPPIPRFAARPFVRGAHSLAVHGHQNQIVGRPAIANVNRAAGPELDRHTRFDRNRTAAVSSDAVRHTLNSRAVAGALHDRIRLRDPAARAQVTASAATAAWRGGGGDRGRWRHRHGGYGWVGPLFWPFAYDDVYDYAMWGYEDDTPFWDYGYDDIYAGLFYPYGYYQLAGYLPESAGRTEVSARQSAGNPPAASGQIEQMCGEDSRDIAGLPIDQIQKAIQPDDAQRAALDDLANASAKAAQEIKAACPTGIALTAPDRLADMQARIEAMIGAVGTVQPPLQKFYDSLNDEQKARLNALGQDQRRQEHAQNGRGSLAEGCGAGPSSVTNWPTAEIDARLHPTTPAQHESLAALKDASARAADQLKGSCQFANALTPPARLAAVEKRLDVMLQAVRSVRGALDSFYAKLSDEQKAQFEAIGPQLAGLASQPAASATPPAARHARLHHHYHHHYHASIGGILRRLISLAR